MCCCIICTTISVNLVFALLIQNPIRCFDGSIGPHILITPEPVAAPVNFGSTYVNGDRSYNRSSLNTVTEHPQATTVTLPRPLSAVNPTSWPIQNCRFGLCCYNPQKIWLHRPLGDPNYRCSSSRCWKLNCKVSRRRSFSPKSRTNTALSETESL